MAGRVPPWPVSPLAPVLLSCAQAVRSPLESVSGARERGGSGGRAAAALQLPELTRGGACDAPAIELVRGLETQRRTVVRARTAATARGGDLATRRPVWARCSRHGQRHDLAGGRLTRGDEGRQSARRLAHLPVAQGVRPRVCHALADSDDSWRPLEPAWPASRQLWSACRRGQILRLCRFHLVHHHGNGWHWILTRLGE